MPAISLRFEGVSRRFGATLAIAIYLPGCAYGCPEGACGDDSTLIIDAGDVIDGAAVTPDAATGLLDAMPVVVDAVPI